jgi:DNA-binding transcriptional regulator PaaX
MRSKLISAIPRHQKGSRYYRILEEISAGDLFIGFLTSAGSSRLMHKVARDRAKERYANKLALQRLEGCGYVKRRSQKGKKGFFVTKEGKKALDDIYKHSFRAIMHPKKWDKMWRVVTYDFPETERSARNSLRHVLLKSHFLQLQKSVWIFPYDSTLLRTLLIKNDIVRAHTVFMKVTHVSSARTHKKHFGLS